MVRPETKERFEEIELEDLRHTVVRYINNEETNFENTAMIIIVYDVAMKNGGETKATSKIQESLAFRKEDGKWLVTMNERGFLVQK